MSYARWDGWSHVYVFHDTAGGITCMKCLLRGGRDYNTETHEYGDMPASPSLGPADFEAAIAHMLEHQAAGQNVPAGTLDRLSQELAEMREM